MNDRDKKDLQDMGKGMGVAGTILAAVGLGLEIFFGNDKKKKGKA